MLTLPSFTTSQSLYRHRRPSHATTVLHSWVSTLGGPEEIIQLYKADVAAGTDLVKWHCNSDQVFVVFASIPYNYESPATNFCCKTKKAWCCMTCCVSNSCMYPCVPMLGRGRYASVSHDRRIHVHKHAMQCHGTRPFSNRASQPATAQKIAKCARALHE